jgi:hypothetical protein
MSVPAKKWTPLWNTSRRTDFGKETWQGGDGIPFPLLFVVFKFLSDVENKRLSVWGYGEFSGSAVDPPGLCLTNRRRSASICTEKGFGRSSYAAGRPLVFSGATSPGNRMRGPPGGDSELIEGLMAGTGASVAEMPAIIRLM